MEFDSNVSIDSSTDQNEKICFVLYFCVTSVLLFRHLPPNHPQRAGAVAPKPNIFNETLIKILFAAPAHTDQCAANEANTIINHGQWPLLDV